jgi:hypothetical protein
MKTEKINLLTFLFWANFASFIIHLLDESIMAGGFVSFVQRNFWQGFTMTDFFQANAIWLIVIALSNILYDWKGARYPVIAAIPLAFVWERCFNAIAHVFLSLYCKEYSPGLVSSLLFFVILYFIIRFVVVRGNMKWKTFLVSAIPALIFELLFVSSMWWAH